jgi:hypothetical protein
LKLSFFDLSLLQFIWYFFYLQVPNYFDQQRPESVKKRLVKRLEKLGYQVTLEPVPVVA